MQYPRGSVPDDGETVRAVVAGDSARFGVLVERYWSTAVALALEASDGATELALRWGTAHASLVSSHPPFFIRTPQARIEALGTEFTVSVR